jgi:hypothetical protein
MAPGAQIFSPKSDTISQGQVSHSNERSLPRFFVVNHVLARPYLAKFSYTSFCIVEGSRCLDEMHVSIALQLENVKGRTQPRLRFGTVQLAGTGGVIITQGATSEYS